MDIAKRHDCSTLSYDERSGTFWLRGKAVPLEEIWRIQRRGEFTWLDGTYQLWFQCNFASGAGCVATPAPTSTSPMTRGHKVATGVLSVSMVAVVLLGFALFSGTSFQQTHYSYGLSAKERAEAAQRTDRPDDSELITADFKQDETVVTTSAFR